MSPPPHLPEAFAGRMRALLGSEADALFEMLAQPPLTGLRVNTFKLEPDTLTTLVPWELTPVPWCPAGFIVEGDAQPGKHPFHAAGLYYLQEPTAMAVAEALAPQPGERMLDLAAAPGGKATHLTSLVDDTGLVVANEVNRGRTKALTENLERWGATHAVVTNDEAWRLAKAWGPAFDRVLLDAPCSGEGMFRKSEDALRMWSETNVRGCARRQDDLLSEAAALVRPGGVLVYSTCTFAPEENEQVIAAFLKAHPDFALKDVPLVGATAGRPDWVPDEPARADLSKTLRFWPHRVPGEGHFVAVLERSDGPTPQVREMAFRPVPRQVRDLWQAFVKDTLPRDPAADLALTVFGTKLHAVPDGVPNLSGLKAVRAGLWLGTLHKNRFEPSHSLALALKRHEAQRARHLDLSPDDARLARYLQGDVLDDPGEDGWLLVTVAGYPLGWGRRAQGVIKNAYPKGLRRLSNGG